MDFLRPVRYAMATIAVLVFVSLFTAARADATSDLCPATVMGFHSITDNALTSASPLYGYKLAAFGERTASGVLTIQTDKGWYKASFADIKLNADEQTFNAGGQSYDLTPYDAPTQFVRFPVAVTVQRMWVSRASAKDDGAFGWEARGSVSCDPPGAVIPDQPGPDATLPDPDEHPPTNIESPFADPPAAAVAIPISPPEDLGCAQPFVDATVTNAVQAPWPDVPDIPKFYPVTALVAVMLDANGHPVDAWTWVPPPIFEMTDLAIDAAVHSSYTPAVALCHNVPSIYIFKAAFRRR